MRSLLTLSALALLGLLAAPGTAGAAAAPPVEDFVPGNSCSVLGTSHMAHNNTGLVICALVNDLSPVPTACGAAGTSSECKWKLMSQNEDVGRYQVSCSNFSNYMMCIRLDTATGATLCRSQWTSWGSCVNGDPNFPIYTASTPGRFSITCSTFSQYIQCVRTDTLTGSSECRKQHGPGAWSVCAAGSPGW